MKKLKLKNNFFGGENIKTNRKVLINKQIKAKEVRLIDINGQQIGIFSIDKALSLSEKAGFDLVEISADAKPPVCRFMDYGKYLFEQGKKKSNFNKKNRQIHIKEVKLRPVTDVGDYLIKLRHLIKFLKNGNKVKVTLRFKGREMSHKDLGIKMLQKIANDIVEYGIVEYQPKFEGRQIIMMLSPNKN